MVHGSGIGRIIGQLGFLAALLVATPGQAQDAIAPGAEPPARSMTLATDFAFRMTLPVYIAGSGPYPFMIDTGSQRTVVSAELAGLLTLRPGADVRIISLSGPTILPTANIPHLRYGEEEVRDIVTPLIAETHLGGPGILGLDGLQGKRLVMNFAAQHLEIRDSRPEKVDDDDDGTIVVRARNRMGQLILVNSQVGGRRTNVILDTGAEYSVGNMALLHALRADRLALPPVAVQLVSVTGQAVEAQMAAVKTVEIGGVVMQDVPVIFTDAAPFRELKLADKPAMFLGMQILRLFDQIAIDFERKHVDFQMPKPKRAEAVTEPRAGDAG